MDLFEFLKWFYSWFFAITIPAGIIVWIYNYIEKK